MHDYSLIDVKVYVEDQKNVQPEKKQADILRGYLGRHGNLRHTYIQSS
jgi:uncharacterized protein YcbX